MYFSSKCRQGFSLIEILVVITIIALIATFGHSALVAYSMRSRVAESYQELEEYKIAATNLLAKNGSIDPYYVLFPSGDETGIISGAPGGNSAVKLVTLKNIEMIKAYTGTDSNTGLLYILIGAMLTHQDAIYTGSDMVYIVGLYNHTGTLLWQCGPSVSLGDSVSLEYLPKTCQTSLP